jgi:hypothetical protein
MDKRRRSKPAVRGLSPPVPRAASPHTGSDAVRPRQASGARRDPDPVMLGDVPFWRSTSLTVACGEGRHSTAPLDVGTPRTWRGAASRWSRSREQRLHRSTTPVADPLAYGAR